MQNLILGFVGITLLVFCVVDLYHLKQMLKTMRSTNEYLCNMEGFEKMKLKIRRKK